ncbi:unnamed protein product [Brassicogethes aeneus]|uniref:Uncharacterized protein n=1 Tax=Brassicogethes aeneus TaxID=1431903 RepID=A0A9P0FEE0_BRAAE|nr:unnamed protein product [Brassicogethes aeneus]
MILCMIDGKVCNCLTGTKSSQTCYICGAQPKDMNSLNFANKQTSEEALSFGLSTLHAWIRFFECCLHVAYRLTIKSWQVKSGNKNEMLERKQQIINNFKKELGILIDQPKPGSGSTNTGNTARIFFRNYQKSAEITGINLELLRRFYIILQVISCGFEVDVEKFKIYTTNTAKLYVSLYSWYYMPPSMHKILIHGAEAIKHAIVPIGQLGEEAQEAKNKDFKFILEHMSRKDSSVHTNRDIFNYLLLSSDPCISFFSVKKAKQNKLKLSKEALDLLKAPSINASESSDLSDPENMDGD